jgi:N-methylhydantoinase B/oxoprolinase/acetone carboxylase alpha subunit
MKVWVATYRIGDIDGIVCATENIDTAIAKIIDEQGSWADYFLECWENGRRIGRVAANHVWNSDGDSVNEYETFNQIKSKCIKLKEG